MTRKYHVMPWLCLCLSLLLLLCGCTQTSAKLTTDDLAFPGTEWNMSVEEVQAALEIPDEQWVPEKEGIYTLDSLTLWEKEVIVSFQFRDFTDAGHLGLYQTVVLFPDQTDSEALKAEIQERIVINKGSYADADIFFWSSFDKIGNYEKEMRAKGMNLDTIEALVDAPVARLCFLPNAAKEDDLSILLENRDIPPILRNAPECPAIILCGDVTSVLQEISTYREP